ncbi:MAG: FtsW/RodA/SpoVE family cell cycle protein [Aquificota bacterium]|nr:MAG: FtsW/RodA/SpoVE family cell cycle protein [Aquificota bacterium]
MRWDIWLLYSLFGIFLLGEFVLFSTNIVPYLWSGFDQIDIYKKPVLQLLAFLAGLLLAHLISGVDYRLYTKGKTPYIFVGLSVVSLVLVLIKKVLTHKPVDRWLIGTSLQPLEFSKVAVVVFLASYIAYKGDLRRWRYLLWAIGVPFIISLLVLPQPDKGGAIFIALLSGLIIYVGGVPKKAYLLFFALTLLLLYFAFSSKGYVAERLSAWKDPFADPEDSGYQILQSLYALARGGLFGVGAGQGIQKMGALPTADTDYAVAVLAEELGFVGVLTLSLLYSLFVGRLFWQAIHTQDRLGKLLLFGIGSNFALSFLWNMGVVSNLLPPKGIALPFVSYGLSNILSSMLMVGIAQSVINYQDKKLSAFSATSSAVTPLRHI